MKKIKTTYAKLHESFVNDNMQELYVKDHKGDFAPILATVKKEATMMFVSFDTGYEIEVAKGHSFMDKNGEAYFARDLEIGSEILTTYGLVKVTNIKESSSNEAFDISIPSPHWYINLEKEGIIHHNTLFTLITASAYLKQHKDSICVFYDCEFGSPVKYFKSAGISPDRVLHKPFTTIEEIREDMVNLIEATSRHEKIIIIVDSVGNAASAKEVKDAMEGSEKADMTRAKVGKSLWRIITPKLKKKDIPLLAVGHTYETQEMFSKTVVSGGCLVAGSKILMANTPIPKNIEDILVGDFVQTLDGIKEVTHTWNPETLNDGFPECYEITFINGHRVTCSEDHPFLLDDEFVEASKLVIGDKLTTVHHYGNEEIINIEKVGKKKVYDITVADNHQYVLENGVVTHNTGIYYSAANIFIIGRQMDKNSKKELKGYHFIINVEKSRMSKEKSKIPITVKSEGGIVRWSGLFEMGIDSGYINKVNNVSHEVLDIETGEIFFEKLKRADIENNAEVWKTLFSKTQFGNYIEKTYSLSTDMLITDEPSEEGEGEEND